MTGVRFKTKTITRIATKSGDNVYMQATGWAQNSDAVVVRLFGFLNNVYIIGRFVDVAEWSEVGEDLVFGDRRAENSLEQTCEVAKREWVARQTILGPAATHHTYNLC